MVVVGQPNQPGAEQRPAAEVERLPGEAGGQVAGPRPTFGQVDNRQLDRLRRVDHLPELAAVVVERRPQSGVPLDHAGERRPQGIGVGLAGEFERVGDRVDVAALAESGAGTRSVAASARRRRGRSRPLCGSN